MSMFVRLLVPSCLLACGLALPAPVVAVQVAKYNYLNPAAACQLSVPTTDTAVRPKATGYRNESSTKSAFVVCGYGMPSNDSLVTLIDLHFVSIDGTPRNISCTAVSGTAGLFPQTYSTKSVSSGSGASQMQWAPSDFAGTTDIPYTFSPSVTCTLPPLTAITFVDDGYRLEIGS